LPLGKAKSVIPVKMGIQDAKTELDARLKFGHDNGQDKDFHWSLTQYFIFDGNDDTGD